MAEVFDNDLADYLDSFDEKQECRYCGEETDGAFCDRQCEKAFYND